MLSHNPVTFHYTAPGNSHDFIVFVKENLSEHMDTLPKTKDFKIFRYSILHNSEKNNTIIIYTDRSHESPSFHLRYYHEPIIIINYTDTAHGLDLNISMTAGSKISRLIIISIWSLVVVMAAFDSFGSRIAAFLLLGGFVYFGARMLNPFEKACNVVKQQYFDVLLETYFNTHGMSLNEARPT